MKLRIKNLEPFKDGNVLGGRFLKVNEILVVDEMDADKIENSGGVIERIEMVIPNPVRAEPEEPEKKEPLAEISSYAEVEPATDSPKKGQVVRRPRGSKKK